MQETFIVKALYFLWDILKGLIVLFIGFLTYLWRKQEKKVEEIESKIIEMKAEIVTIKELDAREAKIMNEVRAEHQRIIDVLENSLEQGQSELRICNQNVMEHINKMSDQIGEIRTFMFNHLERRQKDRD